MNRHRLAGGGDLLSGRAAARCRSPCRDARAESDVDDAVLARPALDIEAADIFAVRIVTSQSASRMVLLVMGVLRPELHVQERGLLLVGPGTGELLDARRSIDPGKERQISVRDSAKRQAHIGRAPSRTALAPERSFANHLAAWRKEPWRDDEGHREIKLRCCEKRTAGNGQRLKIHLRQVAWCCSGYSVPPIDFQSTTASVSEP